MFVINIMFQSQRQEDVTYEINNFALLNFSYYFYSIVNIPSRYHGIGASQLAFCVVVILNPGMLYHLAAR